MVTRVDYDKRRTLAAVLGDSQALGFEVTEQMADFAQGLGRNYELLRRLFWAYRRGEQVFEHVARIGAGFMVGFGVGRVSCQRLGKSFELTEEGFVRLLGVVDACCAPVYPVGSVAELDVAVMPEPVRKVFGGKGASMLVCLTGRKLSLVEGFEGYVADYLGWLWPFGQVPGQEPMVVASVMIKKIVSTGLTNADEEEFVVKGLRLPQVAAGQVSSVFMPEEMVKDYLAVVEKLAVKGRR